MRPAAALSAARKGSGAGIGSIRPMWSPTPQRDHAPMTELHSITLRNAAESDADALRRLAELDSARPLAGAAVVALIDGRPVAAASVQDGSVVADPFVPTTGVRALLRARARH